MAQQQWMPAPQASEGCPKGLEYLTQIDQLVIEQKVDLLEAFVGFEVANQYVIRNTVGQQVYFAAENSNCCERQCCTNARSFEMRIVDNNNQDVMIVKRPLRCTSSCYCCECCRQFMEIEAPPGNTIGFIKADCAVVYPTFTVMNENSEPILQIKGPCCGDGCCTCSPKYSVRDLNGLELGVIQKKFSGLAKELFTQADNFGINFPMDLDVKAKATLLGAVFLIDFLYFENDGSEDNNDTACCALLSALG